MGRRVHLAEVGYDVSRWCCKVCGKRYVVEILARDCETAHARNVKVKPWQ